MRRSVGIRPPCGCEWLVSSWSCSSLVICRARRAPVPNMALCAPALGRMGRGRLNGRPSRGGSRAATPRARARASTRALTPPPARACSTATGPTRKRGRLAQQGRERCRCACLPAGAAACARSHVHARTVQPAQLVLCVIQVQVLMYATYGRCCCMPYISGAALFRASEVLPSCILFGRFGCRLKRRSGRHQRRRRGLVAIFSWEPRRESRRS